MVLSPKYRTTCQNTYRDKFTPRILSDYCGVKMEINDRRNRRKNRNTWKINNTVLTNQWVREEIKESIQELLKVNDNATTQ